MLRPIRKSDGVLAVAALSCAVVPSTVAVSEASIIAQPDLLRNVELDADQQSAASAIGAYLERFGIDADTAWISHLMKLPADSQRVELESRFGLLDSVPTSGVSTRMDLDMLLGELLHAGKVSVPPESDLIAVQLAINVQMEWIKAKHGVVQFGPASVENDTLVVPLIAPSPAAAQDFERIKGPYRVVAEGVAFSSEQLRSLASKVTSELSARTPTQSGDYLVGVGKNRISIGQVNPSEELRESVHGDVEEIIQQAMAAFTEENGLDGASLQDVDISVGTTTLSEAGQDPADFRDNTPGYAGKWVAGNGAKSACTASWIMKSGTSRAFLTAGHCSTQLGITHHSLNEDLSANWTDPYGESIQWSQRQNNGGVPYDYALIPRGPAASQNILTEAQRFTSVVAAFPSMTVHDGVRVCWTGLGITIADDGEEPNSDVRCGIVDDVEWFILHQDNCFPFIGCQTEYINVDDLRCAHDGTVGPYEGDSGGPAFVWNNTNGNDDAAAVGMITHNLIHPDLDVNMACYHTIDALEAQTGYTTVIK
jgi:hypothetical protein